MSATSKNWSEAGSFNLHPLFPYIRIDLIMVDGHHRAYTYHRVGSLVVPSIIYTEDKDLEGATGKILSKMSNLEAVRQIYRDRWQINMAGLGVTSIADLPVHEFAPVGSWQPALVDIK